MHWRGTNRLAVRVWWSENVWGLSMSVCFFALGACLDSFGDKSYIHGERLAGCILDKRGGFRLGNQLREHGGQVSECRRSRRVQRLSLEKDALSFLHPRVILHQLWVQEGILWDNVLYPLDQAVCGESRVQKGALFTDCCLAYLQHNIIIGRGRAAVRVALAGFVGCSSTFGVFLAL